MADVEAQWPADGLLLDWSAHVPDSVEVRAFPLGIITMKDGKAQAMIDTTDMTRDEVVRSIAVALAQIEAQKNPAGNRKQRRADEAAARHVFN